jgi:hypothetical protein
MKFFAEKKYHQAMLCYQTCVHIDPRNWKYASNISEINLRLRKYGTLIAMTNEWADIYSFQVVYR